MLLAAEATGALPTAASSDDSEDDQEYHGADGSRDNRANKPGANEDAQPRQQPSANESADDSDDYVANESEACPLHELSGEPAGNETDDHNDEKTFI